MTLANLCWNHIRASALLVWQYFLLLFRKISFICFKRHILPAQRSLAIDLFSSAASRDFPRTMHLEKHRDRYIDASTSYDEDVKQSSIRALAVDIDGTLTDPSFKVSPQNIAALRAAHEAGIQIILATGRRHDYAMPIAEEIGIPLLLVSSNGALVRSNTGETFYTDRLPARTATRLIQYMNTFRGHAVLTFDRKGNNALVLEKFEELNQSISRWLHMNESFIQYVSPLEDALTEDPIQAMYCGRIVRMQEAERKLAQADFLAEITVMKTQYDHRDLCILDILNRECSKGHALRRWAGQNGVSRQQIMAIGDNYNDLEMLEFAGLPVVMGNASEEMKQSGWKVTASNAESGVARALEEILGLAFSS